MIARILIIEDNPTNLELMVYLMQKSGYEVLTAMDGEEGLAVVEKENPDLIICDIQLPKINGFEVAKSLKHNPKFENITLIAVTAYSMVGDKDGIMAAGYNGYISKPIDPEKFVKQIEEFLPTEERSPQGFFSYQEEKVTPQRRPKTGEIVLVVDDSDTNRILSETLLESMGINVLLADNVERAFALLDKTSPDLILSDMHMPQSNGLDFFKRLNKNKKFNKIPFTFISSSIPTKEEKKECTKYNIQIILRPIDSQIYVNKIQEILRFVKDSKNK